jgi:hypothetical protein
MLNDPVSAKMPALIAYVQGGIDRYHLMLDGHRWNEGQGYNPDMKEPIYFMAAMFQDPAIIQSIQSLPQAWTEAAELYRGVNGTVLFGDTEYYGDPEQKYWGNIAASGAGNHEYRDPYGLIDGSFPPDPYQDCCLSQPWKGQALAVQLMPGLKSVFNFTMLLEYADRWVTLGLWMKPDTCAPYDGSMSNYGVTFGPNGHSGCIQGSGRFPAKHGTDTDGGGYGSTMVNEMWAAYRNTVGIQPPAMTEKYMPQDASLKINDNPLVAAVRENAVITFSLMRTQKVTVSLYSSSGQVVRSLADGLLTAGPQQVMWDGKDRAGQKIKSGIYYVVLETDGKREIKRIAVID